MLHDGKVLVNTSRTRKYFNIRRDDGICFHVDDGHPFVIIFGKVGIAT